MQVDVPKELSARAKALLADLENELRGPTVSGVSPTSPTPKPVTVQAGSHYAFQPATTDPSGGALTFSITGLPT